MVQRKDSNAWFTCTGEGGGKTGHTTSECRCWISSLNCFSAHISLSASRDLVQLILLFACCSGFLVTGRFYTWGGGHHPCQNDLLAIGNSAVCSTSPSSTLMNQAQKQMEIKMMREQAGRKGETELMNCRGKELYIHMKLPVRPLPTKLTCSRNSAVSQPSSIILQSTATPMSKKPSTDGMEGRPTTGQHWPISHN